MTIIITNLIRSGLLCSVSFFAADAATQQAEIYCSSNGYEICKRRKMDEDEELGEFEWMRSLNFGISGFACGVYQDCLSQSLDIVFTGHSAKVVFCKVLSDQVLNFFYVAMVQMINAKLAGESAIKVWKDSFWKVYQTYVMADVPIDTFVFSLIPIEWQGLTQAVMQLFLSAVLSHVMFENIDTNHSHHGDGTGKAKSLDDAKPAAQPAQPAPQPAAQVPDENRIGVAPVEDASKPEEVSPRPEATA